jgi:hypothetical protein
LRNSPSRDGGRIGNPSSRGGSASSYYSPLTNAERGKKIQGTEKQHPSRRPAAGQFDVSRWIKSRDAAVGLAATDSYFDSAP